MTELPEIRKARNGDGGAIAALHCRRILSGLLTALGESFTAAFYVAMIDSPIGFAYVATEGNRVIGFASGLVDGKQFYQEALNRALGAVSDGALASLIRDQWRGLPKHASDGEAFELPPAEVVSIAVEPGALAEIMEVALVQRVLDEFVARGVGTVRVTAEASNNEASRLYERAGFRRYTDVLIQPDETAVVYVLSLSALGKSNRILSS